MKSFETQGFRNFQSPQIFLKNNENRTFGIFSRLLKISWMRLWPLLIPFHCISLCYIVNFRPLREVFHHIAACTAARFHGNATAPHIGVGGIVFLRFIGPAISIPASIQSNGELHPGVKRALVLVTKVIQNLASNAMFTESNMVSLNPFLESNIKRVLEFIRGISVSSCKFFLMKGPDGSDQHTTCL